MWCMLRGSIQHVGPRIGLVCGTICYSLEVASCPFASNIARAKGAKTILCLLHLHHWVYHGLLGSVPRQFISLFVSILTFTPLGRMLVSCTGWRAVQWPLLAKLGLHGLAASAARGLHRAAGGRLHSGTRVLNTKASWIPVTCP